MRGLKVWDARFGEVVAMKGTSAAKVPVRTGVFILWCLNTFGRRTSGSYE